jgi:hypothetical protein
VVLVVAVQAEAVPVPVAWVEAPTAGPVTEAAIMLEASPEAAAELDSTEQDRETARAAAHQPADL